MTHIINDQNRQEYYQLAHQIFVQNAEQDFELCSIINAKSGLCSEDCKWCAQSRHHTTQVETHGIISKEKCIAQAKYLESKGVTRFSLVTSGKRLTPKELKAAIENIKAIKEHTNIKVCASMGLLDYDDILLLREAGVERYHCNLETSSDHFSSLCTTHTTKDKIATLKAAKRAGLDICCGGIIGLGESPAQRLQFAHELRAIETLSIPINILQPIPGTPMEKQDPLSQTEILDTLATIRILNPKARIRFAAGRSYLTPETIKTALFLGVNSAITGDLLTTTGSTTEQDISSFLSID